MSKVDSEILNAIAQESHRLLEGKYKRINRTGGEIIREGRIIVVMCGRASISPTRCADELNSRYGYSLKGDNVLEILRRMGLSVRDERVSVFKQAEGVARAFGKVLQGEKGAADEVENLREAACNALNRKHNPINKIILLMLYWMYPGLGRDEDKDRVAALGTTLSKHMLCDLLEKAQELLEEEAVTAPKEVSVATYLEALKRIRTLERIALRTDTLLNELQEEFRERLEESSIREMRAFFAKLNSDRYGCLLDELLAVRKGVDRLRRQGYELPEEISGLFVVIKNMIKFVMDNSIEPMMKPGEVLEVTPSMIESCDYEGTPFGNEREVKRIRVISPGWVHRNKGIQISRPRVKEEIL